MEKKTYITIKKLILPVSWMVIIFLLSSRHSTKVSDMYVWNFLFFKALHVIEYGILFVLWVHALSKQLFTSTKFQRLIAVGIAVVYAISDEFHQTFVPTREGKPRDVIIDAIGVTLSWLILVYLSQKTKKKQSV